MSRITEKAITTAIAVLTLSGLTISAWQSFAVDSSEAKSIANEEAHNVVDTAFMRIGYETKEIKRDIHEQSKDLDTIKAMLREITVE